MPIVREFARLTTDNVVDSIDYARISSSAFDWLLQHVGNARSGLDFLELDGPRTLKVVNYVGLIETPCGTRLEILPKHVDGPGDIADARSLLVNMISEAMHLKPRVTGMADITRFRLPLPEWLAAMLLEEATRLVRHGLRRAYHQADAREPYLRGALDLSRQIRGAATGAHLFAFRHDVFSFDRPENRLIRAAVEFILKVTRSSENWRLARELSIILTDIPASSDIAADLRAWSSDRLMTDYSRIHRLCDMVLKRQAPFSTAGSDVGLSMLFPMERLFEHYVTASLRRAVPANFQVRAQSGGLHLCRHDGADWFKLRPDIIVDDASRRWVIDAKWKLLNGNPSHGYGLNQADFYQLYAYGQKYLEGIGDVYLLYPKTTSFSVPLKPFHLTDTLRLHVLPFDLAKRSAPYDFLSNDVEQLENVMVA